SYTLHSCGKTHPVPIGPVWRNGQKPYPISISPVRAFGPFRNRWISPTLIYAFGPRPSVLRARVRLHGSRTFAWAHGKQRKSNLLSSQSGFNFSPVQVPPRTCTPHLANGEFSP